MSWGSRSIVKMGNEKINNSGIGSLNDFLIKKGKMFEDAEKKKTDRAGNTIFKKIENELKSVPEDMLKKFNANVVLAYQNIHMGNPALAKLNQLNAFNVQEEVFNTGYTVNASKYMAGALNVLGKHTGFSLEVVS